MGTITYLWLRRAERDAAARIAARRAQAATLCRIAGDDRTHRRQDNRAACGAEGALIMTNRKLPSCPGCWT